MLDSRIAQNLETCCAEVSSTLKRYGTLSEMSSERYLTDFVPRELEALRDTFQDEPVIYTKRFQDLDERSCWIEQRNMIDTRSLPKHNRYYICNEQFSIKRSSLCKLTGRSVRMLAR